MIYYHPCGCPVPNPIPPSDSRYEYRTHLNPVTGEIARYEAVVVCDYCGKARETIEIPIPENKRRENFS